MESCTDYAKHTPSGNDNSFIQFYGGPKENTPCTTDKKEWKTCCHDDSFGCMQYTSFNGKYPTTLKSQNCKKPTNTFDTNKHGFAQQNIDADYESVTSRVHHITGGKEE